MQFGKSELERPIHGGISLSELKALGLQPEEVIDFSANINPLGVSPLVKKAMARMQLASYPDPDCHELRQAIAKNVGVTPENIVVGNGSTELVHLIARAYLADNGCAAILAPTFGEYESACKLVGATPVFIHAKEADNFLWNITSACQQLAEIKPKVVFLCNPNNPTGVYLEEDTVQKIAKAAMPGLLVIDEAYLPFVEQPWNSTALLSMGNVILLHSMTKDYGLAGLRLGYTITPEKTTEMLKLCQPSWSVNIAAQVAGLAALSDHKHISRAKKIINEAKAYLYSELGEMGFKALPSSANFILVKVGNAQEMRLKLLQRGLCVRDCASFGLPTHIRIAVRTLPECQRFVRSLKELRRD